MTAIVGVVDGTGVVLGGDSCAADSGRLAVADDPKVLLLSPEIAVGYSGDWLFGDILRRCAAPKRVSEQWIRRTLPVWIRTELQALGVAVSYTDEDGGCDGSALIGAMGRLWWLETPDLVTVAYGQEYAAAGVGDEVALGALHATKSWRSARRRAVAALEAAAAHVAGVGPPFVLVRAA